MTPRAATTLTGEFITTRVSRPAGRYDWPMARRLDKTLADYVTLALSPALIMLLVGSLMFFLLLAGYRGDYNDRLNWIMGCFVLAIVLIGRISMEEGAEKAVLYGVALTGAMA